MASALCVLMAGWLMLHKMDGWGWFLLFALLLS